MPAKITVEEAAAQLRLQVRSLRGWIRAGKIPAVRVGKRYLLDQADVDRVLREGTRRPAPLTSSGGDQTTEAE